MSAESKSGTTPMRRAADQEELSTGVYRLDRKPETVHARVKRLQDEARTLAREEIASLCRELETAAARAQGIAEGGDAYPIGVREQAERLAEELPLRAEGMTAILDRLAPPRR